MSTEQLEQRLAAVEKALGDINHKLDALANGHQPVTWQPPASPPLPPMTPEEQAAFEDYQAICKYFRKTGQEPPPDWKPGDPIPDPEWWSPPTDSGLPA